MVPHMNSDRAMPDSFLRCLSFRSFRQEPLLLLEHFPISLAMGIVVVGYVVIVLEWFFNLMIPFLFIGINILAYPWTFYVRSRFDKYLEARGNADTIRENTSENQTN